MGFAVLLVSGLLLVTLGLGILKSPYLLTVATLIPLGISMGWRNSTCVSIKNCSSGSLCLASWQLRHPLLVGWVGQENLGAYFPWYCRTCDFLTAILCCWETGRQGFLVGRYWLWTDWAGWHRACLSFCWITITIFQPCFCYANLDPVDYDDDPGIYV